MYKIDLENLLWSLENIGEANVVTVPDEIKTDARMALDRMLALSPKAPSAKKGDSSEERQTAGLTMS